MGSELERAGARTLSGEGPGLERKRTAVNASNNILMEPKAGVVCATRGRAGRLRSVPEHKDGCLPKDPALVGIRDWQALDLADLGFQAFRQVRARHQPVCPDMLEHL